MKKMLALLVTLGALLGVSTAQEPVTIGVNLELSGRFATIGTSTLQGIETALEERATVDGRPIELSICDNQTTPEGSINCAARFVDEGVVGVLGSISTTMSIAAANPLQEAGVIMISTSSTNPATTQIGDHIFRMAYTDDFQGKVAARHAVNELGAERAIVFRQQDDDYSFGLAGFFADEFEALGGETITLDFVANTVDFSAQINDARGFDADVIYYSGFCAEGASLMPQLRQQGFDQQILGADASDDSQCPTGGGEAFDGYLLTGFGGPEVLSGDAAARAEDFASLFDVVFPDAPDFNGFTLAGADSFNVLVQAIDDADSTDGDAVLEALQNLEGYPGVSGEITYAGTDGTPADRTIAFFQYAVPGEDGSEWSKASLFGVGTGE
ncbi:MAG: ABC transporter substrate-binding protein [Trueperaceae bacterium]|nr:ABC transporter substrate-binding protein [Trueperaceae bacterium]